MNELTERNPNIIASEIEAIKTQTKNNRPYGGHGDWEEAD